MVGQLCHSIVNARVPQEPPLDVVDEIAVTGKVDGGSDVGSWCPTRFVGATAVAAVDHVEAVYSGLDLRIGGGGNSHAWDGGRQRQDGNQEGALSVCFHEMLQPKSDRSGQRPILISGRTARRTVPSPPALAAGSMSRYMSFVFPDGVGDPSRAGSCFHSARTKWAAQLDHSIAHAFVSTAVAKSTYFQLALKIDQSEGNFLPHA